MAYPNNNAREWDKHKDGRNEDHNNWNPNVRQREDDYSETKRRKFNNGTYESHDPQQYEAEGHGAPRKRIMPSPPTPHVILLGLDPDFNEADLQSFFAAKGCSIETVTIIRDRSSGVSKGFGFVQFTTTELAQAFVDPSFPFIQVPPPASHGASATAAFHRALETGAPHTGRRVKIDYSQSASPHEKGRMNRHNMNDGTRDIGNSQVPVLLFRGLDPLSGPQAILQAIKSASGPGIDGTLKMKRIILIRDKVTFASFGFAFVEFVDVEAASTIFSATMSSKLHPAGFRISDRPVASSWAHPYSFQPIADPIYRDETCIASSMSLGGVEDTWVKYWDESATIVLLEFDVKLPAQLAAPTVAVEKEKGKKKKTKSDMPTRVSAPAQASALPISDRRVTLTFGKGPSRAARAPVKTVTFLDDDQTGAEDENSTNHKATEPRAVVTLIASKKTVKNISKWNQVQEELTQNTTPSLPIPQPIPIPQPAIASKIAPVVDADEFEFSDVHTFACLLCARQFKSLDQLRRHNKDSDLHKKNYADSALRGVALQKVRARQADQAKSNEPKYRDRASERRVLFNQPDAPVPEKDASKADNKQKRVVEGPPAPMPPPPPPVNPGRDSTNVGNKLLKMMGWTEGTGLGTSGEGRVDPISTAIYASGAGLGASKGKDVGKFAQAQGSYLHMAQDTARERYNEAG